MVLYFLERFENWRFITSSWDVKLSFISVTPLIAIQALGIIYNIRIKLAAKDAKDESLDDLNNFVLDAVLDNTIVESEVCIDESK